MSFFSGPQGLLQRLGGHWAGGSELNQPDLTPDIEREFDYQGVLESDCNVFEVVVRPREPSEHSFLSLDPVTSLDLLGDGREESGIPDPKPNFPKPKLYRERVRPDRSLCGSQIDGVP